MDPADGRSSGRHRTDLHDAHGTVWCLRTGLYRGQMLSALAQKGWQLPSELAEGIALALEFKMGGEVLRTVAVREWSELGILGAIITLRGLLTFLIHWEIKNEQKALEKQHLDRD